MAPQAWPCGNPSVITLGINVASQSFIKVIFFFYFKAPEKHGHCSQWHCLQLPCDNAVNSGTHAKQTKSPKRARISPVLTGK